MPLLEEPQEVLAKARNVVYNLLREQLPDSQQLMENIIVTSSEWVGVANTEIWFNDSYIDNLILKDLLKVIIRVMVFYKEEVLLTLLVEFIPPDTYNIEDEEILAYQIHKKIIKFENGTLSSLEKDDSYLPPSKISAIYFDEIRGTIKDKTNYFILPKLKPLLSKSTIESVAKAVAKTFQAPQKALIEKAFDIIEKNPSLGEEELGRELISNLSTT